MNILNKKNKRTVNDFIMSTRNIIIENLYSAKFISSKIIKRLNDDNVISDICFEEILMQNIYNTKNGTHENYLFKNICSAFGAGIYYTSYILNKKIYEITIDNINSIKEILNNQDFLIIVLDGISIKYNSNNFYVIISFLQKSFKTIYKKYNTELKQRDYILHLMQIYYDAGVTIAELCMDVILNKETRYSSSVL